MRSAPEYGPSDRAEVPQGHPVARARLNTRRACSTTRPRYHPNTGATAICPSAFRSRPPCASPGSPPLALHGSGSALDAATRRDVRTGSRERPAAMSRRLAPRRSFRPSRWCRMRSLGTPVARTPMLPRTMASHPTAPATPGQMPNLTMCVRTAKRMSGPTSRHRTHTPWPGSPLRAGTAPHAAKSHPSRHAGRQPPPLASPG